MAYIESHDLSIDLDFIKKIKIALAKTIVNPVFNGRAPIEPEDITIDEKRKTLALNIIRNFDNYVPIFALLVAANPAINENSPDDGIQFTVDSRFDNVAGV